MVAAEVHPGSKNRRLSKKSWGRHKEIKRETRISVLDTVFREAVIKQEIDALTAVTSNDYEPDADSLRAYVFSNLNKLVE